MCANPRFVRLEFGWCDEAGWIAVTKQEPLTLLTTEFTYVVVMGQYVIAPPPNTRRVVLEAFIHGNHREG
jgi:hypothetical protein